MLLVILNVRRNGEENQQTQDLRKEGSHLCQPRKGQFDAAAGAVLGIDNPTPPQSYEPTLTTAIEQQLGLKLEPRKASMEVLIIEHVERPAEN